MKETAFRRASRPEKKTLVRIHIDSKRGTFSCNMKIIFIPLYRLYKKVIGSRALLCDSLHCKLTSVFNMEKTNLHADVIVYQKKDNRLLLSS